MRRGPGGHGSHAAGEVSCTLLWLSNRKKKALSAVETQWSFVKFPVLCIQTGKSTECPLGREVRAKSWLKAAKALCCSFASFVYCMFPFADVQYGGKQATVEKQLHNNK